MFSVSYYLKDFYHTFIIEADNEAAAIIKALDMLGNRSRSMLHDFQISKYIQEWN